MESNIEINENPLEPNENLMRVFGNNLDTILIEDLNDSILEDEVDFSNVIIGKKRNPVAFICGLSLHESITPFTNDKIIVLNPDNEIQPENNGSMYEFVSNMNDELLTEFKISRFSRFSIISKYNTLKRKERKFVPLEKSTIKKIVKSVKKHRKQVKKSKRNNRKK